LAAGCLAADIPFSYKRCGELQTLGEPALAATYGLKMAVEHDNYHEPRGLSLHHPIASDYYRDRPHDGYWSTSLELLADAAKGGLPEYSVFVNSQAAVHFLQKAMNLAEPLPRTELAPNVVAVHLQTEETRKQAEGQVALHGLRPSAYAVLKLRIASETGSPLDTSIDTVERLKIMRPNLLDSVAQLLEIPELHPAFAIVSGASALLQGIVQELEPLLPASPTLRQSTVIADALEKVAEFSATLSILANDSPRLASCFEALIEEIHVLLSLTRPYRLEHFKQAASLSVTASLREAKLCEHVESQTYLSTSGMDALSTGCRAAEALMGRSGFQTLGGNLPPDYYETLHLRMALPFSSILVAPLRSSMPGRLNNDDGDGAEGEWGVNHLIAELRTALARHPSEPRTLVLDATVEHTGDLQVLLESLGERIASGHLNIVVCKSYQKFSQLGSSKIMAGSVSLIAKKPMLAGTFEAGRNVLETQERDTGWDSLDEFQLLTFLLKYGSESADSLLKRAVANKEFVLRTCFPKWVVRKNEIIHDDGTPFIVLPMQILPKQVHLLLCMIWQRRDGFAYLGSTWTPAGSIRLSLGQESHGELIEAMYGFGTLVAPGEKPISIEGVRMLSEQLADEAVEAVCSDQTYDTWRTPALEILDERRAAGGRDFEIMGPRDLLDAIKSADLPAEKILADKLRLIEATTRTWAASDSVNASSLRQASLSRFARLSEPGLSHHSFTAQKIFSLMMCATQGGTTFPEGDEPEEVSHFDVLYRALVLVNCGSISHAGRVSLVESYVSRVEGLIERGAEMDYTAVVGDLVRLAGLLLGVDDKVRVFKLITRYLGGVLPEVHWRTLVGAYFRPLDDETRRLFVNAYAATEGGANRAYALLEEMKASGPAPDVVTYNSVINAYAATEDGANGAHALLEEMKTLAQSNPALAPNIVTYNSVINAYAAAGWADRAHTLIAEMGAAAQSNPALAPNLVTYQSLNKAEEMARRRRK
jgi:pentatricopeptide repeat protein